jgi:hypothetical protein
MTHFVIALLRQDPDVKFKEDPILWIDNKENLAEFPSKRIRKNRFEYNLQRSLKKHNFARHESKLVSNLQVKA